MEQQMAETLPSSRRQNAEHKSYCRNACVFTVFDRMLQIPNGLCHILINYCKNRIPWGESKKKKLRQSEFYQEENRLHVTELRSISAAFYFLNIPEMSVAQNLRSTSPGNNKWVQLIYNEMSVIISTPCTLAANVWYTKIVGHWQKVKCEYFEWNADCSTAGETVWKTRAYKPKLCCWRKQAKLFSSGSTWWEPERRLRRANSRHVRSAIADLLGQTRELTTTLQSHFYNPWLFFFSIFRFSRAAFVNETPPHHHSSVSLSLSPRVVKKWKLAKIQKCHFYSVSQTHHLPGIAAVRPR